MTNPITIICLAFSILIAPAFAQKSKTQIDESVISKLGSINERVLVEAIASLSKNDTVLDEQIKQLDVRVTKLESKKNLVASASGSLGTAGAVTSPFAVRALGYAGSSSGSLGSVGGNNRYPSTANNAVIYSPRPAFNYQPLPAAPLLPVPAFANNVPAVGTTSVEISSVYDSRVATYPSFVPRGIRRQTGCYRDRRDNWVCPKR